MTFADRITSKDSTNTFIEQVQFTDSSKKSEVFQVHANEQTDRRLTRPLSDKALPHVNFSPPVQ
jgi:hypothetical protein